MQLRSAEGSEDDEKLKNGMNLAGLKMLAETGRSSVWITTSAGHHVYCYSHTKASFCGNTVHLNPTEKIPPTIMSGVTKHLDQRAASKLL